MTEDEIKAGGNPFENVMVATRSGAGLADAPESSGGGGLFDGFKNAMSSFEKGFTAKGKGN